MQKRFSLVAVIALACLAFAAPTYADICGSVVGNLVQNCGFEASTSFPPMDWTFTPAPGGGSDIFLESGGSGCSSGNNCVWFGAVGRTDDTISQTLSNAAGTFDLRFYLGHTSTNRANDFNVFWDGTNVFSITNTASFAIGLVDIAGLIGTGNDTITFAGREVPNWYQLDDVSVVQTSPEPASLLLLGSALAGAGILVRRRFAKQ